ncbi:MAG TPA: hypothetical protein DDY77_06690 [Clostridiales bacterium]|nr:hypothetical protein [Clostridiales bacterium]
MHVRTLARVWLAECYKKVLNDHKEYLMKNKLSKIVVMIMAVVMCLSAFVGCDWITTNVDEDMKQTVATVKISEAVNAEDITKKQLNAGYLSYGYQYVQSYGYTTSKAYSLVLQNLVNNRIIVQQSRVEIARLYNALSDGTESADTEFKKYMKDNTLAGTAKLDAKQSSAEALEKFLSEYEVEQAKYSVRKSINSMIDTYVEDDEEEKEREEVTYTARTTPTEEAEKDYEEWELKTATPTDHEYAVANLTLNEGVDVLKSKYTNKFDLNSAVAKAYKVDYDGKGRKKAYSALVKSLKTAGLIGENESAKDNEFRYAYFEDLYKSQLESALVSRYEDSLIAGVEKTLDGENYDALWDQYKVEYDNQMKTYENDRSAYETALGEVSDTKFVLANPFKGEAYGYVLNLLIGFTDEQSADYSAYSAKKGITEAMKIAYRAKLLENLVAKDQRTSWVQNSYGTYDKTTGKFTFDSKYLVSDDSALSSFIGKVTVKDEDGYVQEDDDGVEETKWQVTDVTSDTIGFDKFYDTYLKTLIGDKKIYEKGDETSIGQATFTDELNDTFNELMFAFSTDTGCLNKTYGYLSTPSNSDYVAEFASAARDVVTKGVGAYTVVATDYGYHIIICTNVISDPYTIDEAGETKFKADVLKEGTIAYKYRNVKVDSVVDSEVSKIANKFISEAKDNEDTVSYNYGAFKDLIEKDDYDSITE